ASRFYIRDDGQNRARTTLVLAVDPIPLQILLGTFIWDPIEKIWPLGLAVGPENRPTQLVSPGFTLVQLHVPPWLGAITSRPSRDDAGDKSSIVTGM
ncbi:hypothetical protein THAOC_22359, partial [Thalassiosira oceanica]